MVFYGYSEGWVLPFNAMDKIVRVETSAMLIQADTLLKIWDIIMKPEI